MLHRPPCLEILNEELKQLIESTTPGERLWVTADIEQIRLIAQCASAAQVVEDLTSMRILRFARRPDSESNVWVVKLSGARRLTIAFKDGNTPMTAVLDLEIGKLK